jgi:hypothetical protein
MLNRFFETPGRRQGPGLTRSVTYISIVEFVDRLVKVTTVGKARFRLMVPITIWALTILRRTQLRSTVSGTKLLENLFRFVNTSN